MEYLIFKKTHTQVRHTDTSRDRRPNKLKQHQCTSRLEDEIKYSKTRL